MSEAHPHSNYVTIWVWLIALLIVGLLVAFLPFGKAMAIFLIFTVAVIKAGLVVKNYMHLTSESLLIHAIAVIPVILLICMALALVPDIVFNR